MHPARAPHPCGLAVWASNATTTSGKSATARQQIRRGRKTPRPSSDGRRGHVAGTNHTATTLSHKRAHDPSVRCSASLARCNRRQRKVVARHGLADRARARRKEGYQADGVSMPLRCVADLSEWQRHPPLGQQGSCQPRLAGLAGIQAKSMHGPGCMDLAARTQAKRPAGSSRPTIRPAAASSNMQQTFSLFAKMRWVVRDHHRHSGVVVAGY